jgi:hypothetical protein
MTTCLCSLRSCSFSLFLFFFTTSFPTSLLRQYPDLQSFPVQKIVNQTKHSGYQSVASEKSTCKDKRMPVVANERALRCSAATRSLEKLWQRRYKRDEDDALCIIDLHSSVCFFFFWQFCVVAKVAMIYRSI